MDAKDAKTSKLCNILSTKTKSLYSLHKTNYKFTSRFVHFIQEPSMTP